MQVRVYSTVTLFGVLLTVGVACSRTSSPSTTTDQLTTKELVRGAKPAIVRITTSAPDGNQGVGTGFVIAANGVITTNLHVIALATEANVQLLSGEILPIERILAYDLERDLVVFKVEAGKQLPILPLADSNAVEAGDPVITIGNPLGVLDYTVSDGLISSVRQFSDSLTVLMFSAPISQGSSGGPLFNPKGEVIGVVRAFISQGQNLNVGIPSNYVRDLIGQDSELTLAKLNETLLDRLAEARRKTGRTPPPRRVPNHDLSFLDGCDKDTLLDTVKQINGAIAIGAPLYNSGNHEGCYRVYEGLALRLEADSTCKGVREAFGVGLKQAGTKSDYSLKAWAMRDTFDGLLNVISRKLSSSATTSPTSSLSPSPPMATDMSVAMSMSAAAH